MALTTVLRGQLGRNPGDNDETTRQLLGRSVCVLRSVNSSAKFKILIPKIRDSNAPPPIPATQFNGRQECGGGPVLNMPATVWSASSGQLEMTHI
jgi:hypothetical protein